ncbi:MAG: N-acetylmuramoyl-L-alanine amidase [Armatimonadota bacterium]|nr:N-acetylmuramoyl-L-alanine amidase [Armatimonadota bacterium]
MPVIRFVRRRPGRGFRRNRRRPIRNIILHSTDGREQGDLATLTGNSVSIHWYVTRTGKIYHIVENRDTAFHAGRVFNPAQFDNDATLGIEQEHFDPDPEHGRPRNENWPDAQIEAVAQVAAFLLQRHNLNPGNIHTHAGVARPRGRKQDPFDYPFPKFNRLLAQNLQEQWTFEEVDD